MKFQMFRDVFFTFFKAMIEYSNMKKVISRSQIKNLGKDLGCYSQVSFKMLLSSILQNQ